jgi:hypothetical protein
LFKGLAKVVKASSQGFSCCGVRQQSEAGSMVAVADKQVLIFAPVEASGFAANA